MKAKRKTTTKPQRDGTSPLIHSKPSERKKGTAKRARVAAPSVFPITPGLSGEEIRSWVNMALTAGAVFYVPLKDGKPRRPFFIGNTYAGPDSPLATFHHLASHPRLRNDFAFIIAQMAEGRKNAYHAAVAKLNPRSGDETLTECIVLEREAD